MLDPAIARLIARALMAGGGTFAGYLLDGGDPVLGATWKGAAVAAFWAIIEYATPLNRSVGIGGISDRS